MKNKKYKSQFDEKETFHLNDKQSRSYFRNFMLQLKANLMEANYYLVEQQSEGMYSYIIAVIIEICQLYNFVFAPQLKGSWKKTSIIDSVASVFSAFMFTHYFSRQSFQLYIIIQYVAIFVILIIILSMSLVIFEIQKKKQINGWSLKFVYYGSKFCSLFYISIQDLFISIFRCYYPLNQSQKFNVLFPNQMCYDGIYYLYIAMNMIISIIFFLFVSYITLMQFECKIFSNDSGSKASGRSSFYYLCFKTVLIILFNTLQEQNYQIILIGTMLLGYFLIFFTNPLCIQVYSLNISKLIISEYSLLFWGTAMSSLAMVTESYSFDGTLQIWIIGIPLMLGLAIYKSDIRYNYMLLDTNNYEYLNQAFDQICYLIKVIGLYKQDKNILIQLHGFIEYHKKICKFVECPIKKKSKAIKKKHISKTAKSQTSELEQLTQVIELIQHLFYISLQKFPNSPKLRILFAIFLMDIAQNKQQSMQELVNSEMEKPSLDEQFTILRLQMYLENQAQSISTNQNQHFSMNQTDFMMDISYQSQMKIFKDLIEASANNYTELWFQLLEDQPDLLKIKQIGFKINDLNNIIDEQFQRISKVSSNFTAPALLFGKYLIELVEDNQRGKQILQQMMGYQQKEQINLNVADPSLEQSPTIIISVNNKQNIFQNSNLINFYQADEDNFGIITNINTSCCCFFGYQKVEMMNRNIKSFMPQIYSDRHDQFIRNFLQTLESRILNVERYLLFMNQKKNLNFYQNFNLQKREIMIKQKNNYIKNANIMVKYIPSLSTGIQFIGQYNVNKVICHTAYMILDTDFYIENITSSCINMIHLDENKLKKRKHIDDIIPKFQAEFKKYFYKGGCEEKITVQNSTEQIILNVQISDINLKNLGNSGYIVKLQNKNKIFEAELNTNEDQKLDSNIKSILNQSILPSSEQYKSQKQEYFLFKYDPIQKHYSGQYYDINASKSAKQLLLSPQANKQKDQLSRVSFFSVLTSDKQENAQSDANKGKSFFSKEQCNQFVQYGEGIKTLRLCGQNIIDIQALKEGEGDEQEEEDKEMQEMNEQENQIEDELNFEKDAKHSNIFKRRDTFVRFINNSDFLNPLLIQRSNLAILFFCAIFLVIFIINFIISGSSISQSENQYTILDNMNKFISEGQYILNCLFDLQLLNSQVYDNKLVDFTQTTKNLSDSLNRMNYYHQNFGLSSMQLDDQSINYLNNPTVPIFNPVSNKTDFFDFYQSSQQFISKINQISSYSLDMFSIKDQNIYYIQYNFLNSYYMISDLISKGISSQISSYSQQLGKNLIQMIIIACVLLFIEIIAIIFIYFSLLLLVKQILVIFLEIPLDKIQQLLFKSKKFNNQIQSGDDENISSSESLTQFKKEDDKSLSITRISKNAKKLRKFRLESKQFKVFFIPFIITILILITYFSATFAIYQPTIQQLQNFSNEFNSTSTLDQIFGISANVVQIMMMNITFQTVNQTSSQFIQQQMYQLYQQLGNIQRYHIENMNLHNSAYNNYFYGIMMSDSNSNPCTLLSTTFQSQDCQKIANQTITKGTVLLLTRQIESMRNIYLTTEYIYQSVVDASEQQIQLNNLLNSDQLSGQMITEINNSISNTNAQNLFVVILCIIFLIVSLIIIWIPLMSNIQRDISRTRNLVILLPLNVSRKCKFLRNLLSQYDEKLVDGNQQKSKK
ncbi:hypothetical protein ABPG74_010355 [Tetrahymena malaccensis]